MTPPVPSPHKLSTLLGGEEVRVATNAGATETVKVLVLPMRSLLRFIELCVDGDGQALIELCIDRPEGYADRFTAEAQDQLLEKARALNFTHAERYLERLNSDSRKLAPLFRRVSQRMTDQLQPVLEQLMTLWPGAPTPASPSAARASKSSTSPSHGSASSWSAKAAATPSAPSTTSTP